MNLNKAGRHEGVKARSATTRLRRGNRDENACPHSFPFVPTCLRAYVPSCLRAFVPRCLRALFECLRIHRAPLMVRIYLLRGENLLDLIIRIGVVLFGFGNRD